MDDIDLDAILGPAPSAPSRNGPPPEEQYAAFAAEEAPDNRGEDIPKSTTPRPNVPQAQKSQTTVGITLQRLSDVLIRLQKVLPEALDALETLQAADLAAQNGGFLSVEIPPPPVGRLPGELPGGPEYNTLSYEEQVVLAQVRPDPRNLGHWLWHGKREQFTQRPTVRWKGTLTTAVRAVWEICAQRPIPPKMRFWRTCPEPLCVRPAAPHHAPHRPSTPSGQDAYWFKIGADGATQAERDYVAPDSKALAAAVPHIPTPRQRPARAATRGRSAVDAMLNAQPRRMDTVGGGMDLTQLNGDDEPIDGEDNLDLPAPQAGPPVSGAVPQLSSVQSLLAAYQKLPHPED